MPEENQEELTPEQLKETVDTLSNRLKEAETTIQGLKSVSESKSGAIVNERRLRKEAQKRLDEAATDEEKLIARMSTVAETATRNVLVERAEEDAAEEFRGDFPEVDKHWSAIQDKYAEEYKDLKDANKKVIRKRLEHVYSLVDEEGFKKQQEDYVRKQERRTVHNNYAMAGATPPMGGSPSKEGSAISPEQEEMSKQFGLDPQTVYKS